MAEFGVEAARWMVGRALGTASYGLLEAWADSTELGANIEALRMELLYAEGMLNNARGRGHGPGIQNPALSELLLKLRDLAYRSHDVMDELEYFRIQDELDGTYHAADEPDQGCLCNHAHHARHTVRYFRKMLGFSSCSASHDEHDEDTSRGVSCGAWPCLGLKTAADDDQEEEEENDDATREVNNNCVGRLTGGVRGTIDAVSKHLPCYSVSNAPDASDVSTTGHRFLCCVRNNKAPQKEHDSQAPKLKFDRVDMSRKMKEIVEQLKPLCAKVSTILNLELLSANLSNAKGMAADRPKTTPESGEPEFYGRKDETSSIISDITKGEHCDRDLMVLPIVGPGGIGKTTLTQNIYLELEKHFEVKLWVCVSSVNFNVSSLTQEIADKIKKEDKDSPEIRIENGLKSKRFLIVLDDMWSCNKDEWNMFLVPFKKGQKNGSVILVTTRLPASAQIVKTTDRWIDLQGLDPESFMELFIAHAFGDKQTMDSHIGLLGTGYKIVEKLKGSPLAAKTVGKLLKNNLDLAHWTRVLDSKEWESQNGDHDIMPALKLSFDYLPFHLQQCFTYSALFPEDYKFRKEELIHFWIGLDVLHSRGQNKCIENIGLCYLIELVNHGFFKKEEDEHGRTYYIVHDLLHELAVKVSEDECLSICSSNNVRSQQIPPSIRHLSINIDESSVKDRKTFDICKEGFIELGKRLKVENLHSFMVFGKQQDSFVKTLHGFLSKAQALRLILIYGVKYRVEDLFDNFLNLVHLRYLRIHNYYVPPKKISRFYHLRVLDLQGCFECFDLPRHMGNLLKLRHFPVPDDRMHANIFEVGRLKSLQELRRFVLSKEKGFELRQIGNLLQLSGSLSIDNLENVEGREEAEWAKLMYKKDLQELILNWNYEQSNKDPAHEEQILEGLKPHSNLLHLSISGHGGATCPSWLIGPNLSVENLDSICLDGVAWETFPPIGELWLVNKVAEEISSNIPDQHFGNLKKIELKNLARLERWIIGSSGHMLSHLEVLIIEECPELVELSFPNSSCGQQEQNGTRFLRLQEVSISSCRKLLSLPPVPWSSARFPLNHSFSSVGLALETLLYGLVASQPGISLIIKGNQHAQDMATSFWAALDFRKLVGLESLVMISCPPLPLYSLQKLWSSIKMTELALSRVSGNELTQVLPCMPKLSELQISNCEKITGLGVMGQQEEAASSSREEEEIAPPEGLLLLPPKLQKLGIEYCPELNLRPDSSHGGNGGGLQALTSLRSLTIWRCPKFLANYLPSSSPSSCFPFPTSLQSLELRGVETLAPLSNLASLTELHIHGCGGSGGAGFRRLLAHGCLHKLSVWGTPDLFSVESSEMLEHGSSFPPPSKLQSLWTNEVAGVLAAPFCTLLSSSLAKLTISDNNEMERLTPEQGEALGLLTSLQQLRLIDCKKLCCLPAGLQTLKKLETLEILGCPSIRSLPKDSLPNSLQKLIISTCPSIRSLPKDSLPNSLQKLIIFGCSSIRSLPKDGLPDCLQELEIINCPSIRALPKGGLPSSLQRFVSHDNSKELIRQCRNLIGTIPIVSLTNY